MTIGTARRLAFERAAKPLAPAVPFIWGAFSSLLFTAFVTWPQARQMTTHVAAHDDARFSMWRLAWAAHAMRTDPRGLFDANIFYPATNTLSYSDATLLEGVLGAPLLWTGVSLILVYNVLLLGGIAASGFGMFVLVRRLTGGSMAATVAAAVFTMAPYRIEHFMHLELQWTMWMPLTFWAVHRALDTASWRAGVVAGVFVWLQIVSCVYYGVFLAIVVAAFLPLALAVEPRRALRALPALIAGGVVAVLLTLPYLWPYIQASRTLGGRDPLEVARYSAHAASYLASPRQNWLWGWTAPRFGGVELSLFPGVSACVLAVVALAIRPGRWVVVYALLAALTVDLSFGVHGAMYSWLVQWVPGLGGLRSPSRFGILAGAMIAVLAGCGIRAIQQRIMAGGSVLAVVAAGLLLMCAEYANTGMWLRVESDPHGAPVYRILAASEPGVVAELPMPTAATLPGHEADYLYWSTAHWRTLVNGYSGYFPPDYIRIVERMRGFPDDLSIGALRALGVRYVILHHAYYDRDQYESMLERLAGYPDLRPYGRYGDPAGEADIFVLER